MIGGRVKALMKEQGYTQRELAEMCGITETAMSRYLNNERQPRLETVANLATALNTTSDYLLKGTEPEKDFANVYRLVARSVSTMTDEEKLKLVKVITEEVGKD
ncbi:MAG: helix-turn-helix transcriptional regulator [Dehalococcoidales bacterium]|nr:helix-turn-helix transcriptional regulator [Dehalococcoidales bacterium]